MDEQDEHALMLEILREIMNNRKKLGFFIPMSWYNKVRPLMDNYYTHIEGLGIWVKEEDVKEARKTEKSLLVKS